MFDIACRMAVPVLGLLIMGGAVAGQDSPVVSSVEIQPVQRRPFPSANQPGHGYENEIAAPGWDWELPIVPQAGRADSQKIYFARVEGGTLEVYSSDLFLTRLQRRMPVFPDWQVTGNQETPFQNPSLFASDDGWIVTEGGQGVWMSGDAEDSPSSVLFAELGLQRIDEVISAEEHFFVRGVVVDELGSQDAGIWYAPRSIAGPAEEWKRVPPAPGNLTDYGWTVSNGRVIVVGGRELGDPTDLVRSFKFGAGGESWRELMYRLPKAPGSMGAVAVNSLAIAFPNDPQRDADGEWPLQQVYWAHDRASVGGTIDQWLAYNYDFPAPRDPFVFTIRDAHVVVFAGGLDGPTGEPNRMAYARAARETNEYRAIVNPPRLPERNALGAPIPRRNEITFAHYQTGLKRAKDQGKHHVVFILDEKTYNDTNARRQFLRDSNVIHMLQDVVVSTPWPDDLPAVRQMIGSDKSPAVALLNPDGELVDAFIGVPNRQEMFRLMQPVLGPAAVAAPTYRAPMQ
jgi:hypothetical protein